VSERECIGTWPTFLMANALCWAGWLCMPPGMELWEMYAAAALFSAGGVVYEQGFRR
jgi:hypothetical protein